MKGIAGEDKKDRPGIERAPRESDFWYPLGRRRQPELLRVHDGFAWRSTADLRPSKNSRWADVAVRQLSYVDCRARADRRSHWAEAVRVLRLRPLGVHSQRSPEPGLSMVRVSLQRFRSEGRTHGWPGCLGLGFGRGAARTRDSRTCRPRCEEQAAAASVILDEALDVGLDGSHPVTVHAKMLR